MRTWDEMTHTSMFGRDRWYYEDRTAITPANRFRLLSSAPPLVRAWDEWHEPSQFLTLLQESMEPSELEKHLGSPIAALQRVVDVWDHLKIRDKFPPGLAHSPSIIAQLSSATDLLAFPSRYSHPVAEVNHRARELGHHRVNVELERNKLQMRYLSKVSTLFSEMRKLTPELRKSLIQLMLDLVAKNEKLIPRWKRLETETSPIGRVSSAVQLGTPDKNPPAPAPPSPSHHLPPPLLERKVIRLIKRPNEPMRAEEHVVHTTKMLKSTV